MRRRYWPAAFALISLIIFGSYIAYTQHLVRRIRNEYDVYTQMFMAIQRGTSATNETQAFNALFDLQTLLLQLDVPIIWYDTQGNVNAQNLPFDTDVLQPDGRMKLMEYMAMMERRGRAYRTNDMGVIYVGSPSIVRYLQWLPWLQVGASFVLVAIAYGVYRTNVRAERERMWAAMARELAHQMGTPLSSLQGWVEVLRLPPDERDSFATADRIGSVMEADVERLERVSRRFELIGQHPSLEDVSVGEVIEELERYFGPRLPRLAGNVALRVRVARSLPRIRANRVLLAWAIENVVRNAVDALAGRGGHILISARRGERGSVHVRVADDGPGIAPEVRGRIFEPGVTTKTSGWGVGLSLTKRIVENIHGGRITAHARRRRGTIFDVELPEAGKRLPSRLPAFR